MTRFQQTDNLMKSKKEITFWILANSLTPLVMGEDNISVDLPLVKLRQLPGHINKHIL